MTEMCLHIRTQDLLASAPAHCKNFEASSSTKSDRDKGTWRELRINKKQQARK